MAEILERRVLVGRAAELARLRSVLAAARSGLGRAVVVGGEAGIGKSRFLEHVAREAEAGGARVLSGACPHSTAGEMPYAPFVEMLRRLVRETPPELLPAVLGPARPDLSRLLPELGSRTPDPSLLSARDRTAQARLFELILGIVQRLASSSTVVLIVDDVQWADQATRDLLGYTVHVIRDDPVLLLLGVRSEAVANEDVIDLIGELEREDHVERIELGPLARDEVAAQLAVLLGRAASGDEVDRVVERTDGNPFYIEELALAGPPALGGGLPPVLRDVLAAHVRALPAPVRDVLRAAAVAGRQIDDDLLARSLATSGRELGALLRTAHERGVLVRTDGPDGPAWQFRHELLREAMDDEVLPAERSELHLAFAEALAARSAAGGWVASARLAEHWDRAGRPHEALAPALRAAREAERAYAFNDALRLWRRAMELMDRLPDASAAAGPDVPDRVFVLERAAESAVLAGEYDQAVELGRAALAEVDAATDPARAGHLLERLRWFLWEAGDRPAAAQAVAAALDLLPRTPPTTALARALAQRAGIELLAQDYTSAVADAREAVAVARAAHAAGETAFSLGVLGWSTAVLGDVETGVAHVREGIAIAEAIGSVEGRALGTSSLVALLDRVGRPSEALEAALAGFDLTVRMGVARTYGALLLGFAARAQLAHGQLSDADATTARGLGLRPTGRAELWLLVNRGRLLALRGAFDEAAALLRRGTELDEGLGHTEFRVALLAARLELAAWSGRVADGQALVARALEVGIGDGPPDPSLAWLAATGLRVAADGADAARAARDETRVRESVAMGERILASVADVAATGRHYLERDGRAGTVSALIAAEGARLHGRDRAAAWQAVADGWAALGRPIPEAYARFRVAAATLRDRGPRETATAALQAAHQRAGSLGAAALAAMAERLARQARIELEPGHGATPAPGPAVHGFTQRELEVLSLVAGGWSNQQIADRLYITRKTASVHVSNILGKLGVASRSEAAAMAHRLGLAGDAPLPPGAS